MLTDRDACIALTTKDRRAATIKVGEVASSRAVVCGLDDDISTSAQDHGPGENPSTAGRRQGRNSGGHYLHE